MLGARWAALLNGCMKTLTITGFNHLRLISTIEPTRLTCIKTLSY